RRSHVRRRREETVAAAAPRGIEQSRLAQQLPRARLVFRLHHPHRGQRTALAVAIRAPPAPAALVRAPMRDAHLDALCFEEPCDAFDVLEARACEYLPHV